MIHPFRDVTDHSNSQLILHPAFFVALCIPMIANFPWDILNSCTAGQVVRALREWARLRLDPIAATRVVSATIAYEDILHFCMTLVSQKLGFHPPINLYADFPRCYHMQCLIPFLEHVHTVPIVTTITTPPITPAPPVYHPHPADPKGVQYATRWAPYHRSTPSSGARESSKSTPTRHTDSSTNTARATRHIQQGDHHGAETSALSLKIDRRGASTTAP